MKFHRYRAICAVIAAVIAVPALAPAQTKLLRFPDIHGDRVVFCYAGDIWLANASGGTALRLTTHPGQEVFPKFSPDGKWIAFTGQYDGDEQVYVIPSRGGTPKQLTYYPARGPLPPRWGFDNQVYGWTPDGRSVLFRSMRYGWDLTDTRLYTVSTDGGLPEPLPMPVSGAGDYSPDGRRMVYSPLIRDFRTWKRYEGGWAEDLYIFDLTTHDTERVTKDVRTDRDPMWIGHTIYFDSDHDGTLNLYAWDTKTKKTEQLTHSTTFDVRWPSADTQKNIVYELGGQLHVFDTTDKSDREISIYVPNDGVASRPKHELVNNHIESWGLSPEGKRAVFVARGDVFTVPAEKGPTRNLTNSSGSHERWPAWSPDGKTIAFISDASGEDEVYVIDQGGEGKPRQITSNGHEMRYRPEWSPDGKWIAFSDKNGRLFIVNVKTQKITQVADEKSNGLNDYSWSPHGGYIAFSLSDENTFRSIYIYSVADARVHRITGETFNERSPVWDPDGNYLYYLADHMFQPQIGNYEWNYVVNRETGIYALALRTDVANPFPPESDEAVVTNDGAARKDKKKAKKEGKKKPLRIDFDGLASRVSRVPVEEDNYYGLSATAGNILYVRGGPFYYGRSNGVKNELRIFSMKDRKARNVVTGIGRGYALSHDGKKVMARVSGQYKIFDAKADAKGKPLSTKNMTAEVVPTREFVEIFNEVWRRYRDFFYAPNMHGYDWKAIGARYRALLPYVAHRADLNYVLGEMIAELTASHSYIVGGDYDIPKRPTSGLPGARFELDREAGRYRIATILPGQNEEPHYRSPLTEVGINVHEGDYVLAIDGVDLTANMNPYQLLLNKGNVPVEMTVNNRPEAKGAWNISYTPVRSEHSLAYLAWVLKNQRRVNEETNGRVGYIHVPDMGSNGIREFIKWYYPQIRKEGLIIDDRANGGGNVSQMLIERLRRTLLSVGYSRNNERPSTYPATVFVGHMVCLINETSASDGDIFPAMFREAGLGPLIGKRTWGGVTGISGHGPLIDGGTVYVPEYGFLSKEGKWIIENHGVDPDIVVENDPKLVIEGHDPQLERGIKEVMKRIKEDPRSLPPRPTKYPVRHRSER